MSVGGSEKEFIFHLYLKTRKERLERALGTRLSEIELEQPLEDIVDRPQSDKEHEGKKKPVDLYAVDNDLAAPVLVESVLGQSNEAHQEKVQRLLDYLDAGRVVYQAFSFQEKHLRELQNLVETLRKPIRLYFVRISEDVLQPLRDLDRLNKLDVYPRLGCMDTVVNVLQVIEAVEHPSFRMLQPQQMPRELNDLSSRIGANRFLLQELQRSIPEFFAFHRGKSRLENRIIYLGGGSSDLMYHCSICDSRGYGFVELRFGNRWDIFNLFAMKPKLLQKCIDKRVYVGNNRIGVEFPACDSTTTNVARIAKIFRAMIDNLSRPLYDILRFEHEVMVMRKGKAA